MWSGWAWLSSTASTSAGSMPAAASAIGKRPPQPLKPPAPLSTNTVRPFPWMA